MVCKSKHVDIDLCLSKDLADGSPLIYPLRWAREMENLPPLTSNKPHEAHNPKCFANYKVKVVDVKVLKSADRRRS